MRLGINYEYGIGVLTCRAGREEIKRLMAVYFEQNVTSEKFEDSDGERWVIPGD